MTVAKRPFGDKWQEEILSDADELILKNLKYLYKKVSETCTQNVVFDTKQVLTMSSKSWLILQLS